jgi:AAA+ superfamily predicted ATPase
VLDDPAPAVGPVLPGRAAFLRLGGILAAAAAHAAGTYGGDAAADPFRGLYTDADQAAAALRRSAGAPVPQTTGQPGPVAPGWDEVVAADTGWAWLKGCYHLTDQELDVLLVALAPEVELAYERVLGYLQDDVTRRRPTVELALRLARVEGPAAGRALLRTDATLVREHLVELVPDPRSVSPPLLAHSVVLDEQVVDVLLGGGGLDRALTSTCRLSTPPSGRWSTVPLPEQQRVTLLAAARAAQWQRPLRLHFAGPQHSGRGSTAAALAGELGAPLLVLDGGRLPEAPGQVESVLFRCFREAVLHGAVLYVTGADLFGEGWLAACLAERTAAHPGLVITSGGGRPPLGVLELAFGRPAVGTRRRAWETCLRDVPAEVPAEVVDALASRFRFGDQQVAAAVTSATGAARLRAAATGPPDAEPTGPTADELFAAARRQTGHRLADLARHVEPARTWTDLVLPGEVTAQLVQLCERVRLRERVAADWGHAGTTWAGRAVTALFTGPPGTGKTLAAEVVAGELGLDLFTIDLASVVSKYIGETEKNLERLFSAASEADAVLFFDEADALFGKRSQVHDAHDRYANIETAYLLQRMEQYDGIAVLATNLRRHLDDAFTRRLQFIVDFPFPDDQHRERIWRARLPAGAPVAAAVDCSQLGRDFRLSGAGISNAVVHAAFLAAADRRAVGPDDLATAARRELEKSGKVAPSVPTSPPAPDED